MKEAERAGLVPVLTEDQRSKICSESHHTMRRTRSSPASQIAAKLEGDYLSLVTHTS